MSGEDPGRAPGPATSTPPAGLKKVGAGVAAAFGFVSQTVKTPGAEATDASTRLAVRRTDLALERSYLAAERTLMGWIRTALSMISFGFTLGKIGQAMHSVEVKQFLGGERSISVRGLAYLLVVLGTIALLGATVQFRLRTNELKKIGLPVRYSIALTVSVLLVVVGGFAFTALVMGL